MASHNDTQFTFCTDHVAYKSVQTGDGKKYYVEGYASTTDPDIVNDIVSKECLDDMARQIKGKNIKLDVEHEAWRKSANTLPIGRVLDARVDKKGLWIKAVLNIHSPVFKEVWGSIKGGFLDAFSIAFVTVKKAERFVEGVKTRILEAVNLLNIALTGNPANPAARITAVMAKSLDAVEHKEADIMPDEPVKEEVKEEPVAEDAPAPDAPSEETKEDPQEEVKEADEPEAPAEVKEDPAVAELKEAHEELKSTVEKLNERLEAAEKALIKPILKASAEETMTEPKSEPKSPLQLVS